jgi:hypothetical protein
VIYLKITKKDLLYSQGTRTITLRMIENILEKHKKESSYDAHSEALTIPVSDSVEVHRILAILPIGLSSYMEEGQIKDISSVYQKKESSNKKNVTNLDTGNKTTLRQFIKTIKVDIQKNFLTKAQIINLKLLTRAQLEKGIKCGELIVVPFGNNLCVNRKSLADHLKKQW